VRKLDIPYFKQPNEHWCGPTALKMFLGAFNSQRVSLAQLARWAGTTRRNGTPARGMITAARRAGQDVQTKQGATLRDIATFMGANLPVIVSFKDPNDGEGHYAVVVGLSQCRIYLHDPYYGRHCSYTLPNFYRLWSAHTHNRWMMYAVWRRITKR